MDTQTHDTTTTTKRTTDQNKKAAKTRPNHCHSLRIINVQEWAHAATGIAFGNWDYQKHLGAHIMCSNRRRKKLCRVGFSQWHGIRIRKNDSGGNGPSDFYDRSIDSDIYYYYSILESKHQLLCCSCVYVRWTRATKMIMMMMTRRPEAIRHSCDILLYRFVLFVSWHATVLPSLPSNRRNSKITKWLSLLQWCTH